MKARRLLGFAVPAMLLGQCGPAQCAPAPPAPPVAGSFGAGVRMVNQDISAGTYIAVAADGCYWQRLSGLGGTFDEIIVNEFGGGQQIVAIEATDVAFSSDAECGRWQPYRGAVEATRLTEGDWAVNQHVRPGRWATEGETDGCYWERAAGFTHEFDELTANDIGDGRRIVDISAADARFTSHRCGAWIRIGDVPA